MRCKLILVFPFKNKLFETISKTLKNKNNPPMAATFANEAIATYSLIWLIFANILQEKVVLSPLTQTTDTSSTALNVDVLRDHLRI